MDGLVSILFYLDCAALCLKSIELFCITDLGRIESEFIFHIVLKSIH